MITLNAFDLLKSIGSSRSSFVVIEGDIEKAALGLMQKLLKAKSLTVAQLHDVSRAIGAATLGVVLDNLAEKDVSGIVKKIDKDWPESKTASAAGQRERVLALATGRAEPAVKPPKAAKSGTTKGKKAAAPGGWSESMSARPPRG